MVAESYWFALVLASLLTGATGILQWRRRGIWQLLFAITIAAWITGGIVGFYVVGESESLRGVDAIFIALHGVEITALMTLSFQLGKVLGALRA